MPDEPSPHIVIRPIGVVHPTAFTLTWSNIEYLLAIVSGRLCALSNMDKSGKLSQTERREASDLYHKLIQITRSMSHYKVADVGLQLPVTAGEEAGAEENA
jgi:hypothetical protein